MSNPIQQLRIDLSSRFPERKQVIDGALAAVIAGEHVLLLGPPGTAKSALARAIAQAFSGVYFERLLTKFSTPEELFGPISLKALEQDRFVRTRSGGSRRSGPRSRGSSASLRTPLAARPPRSWMRYSGDAELLPEKEKSSELRQWAEQIHSVCDQLPEFQRLSAYCRGDVNAAGLAVEELMTLLEPQMRNPPSSQRILQLVPCLIGVAIVLLLYCEQA